MSVCHLSLALMLAAVPVVGTLDITQVLLAAGHLLLALATPTRLVGNLPALKQIDATAQGVCSVMKHQTKIISNLI